MRRFVFSSMSRPTTLALRRWLLALLSTSGLVLIVWVVHTRHRASGLAVRSRQPTRATALPSQIEPRALLLTATPRCTVRHGQFFLTKALQTKAAYARARGWELWPLGGGEMNTALAAISLQPSSTATADEAPQRSDGDPDAQWPVLVLQVLELRLREANATAAAEANPVRWIVWTAPEVLVSRPSVALHWAEWDAQHADLVVVAPMPPLAAVGPSPPPPPSPSARTDSGHEEVLPSLSLALVRVSASALVLLTAWVDAMAADGASNPAGASRALLGLLRKHPSAAARVVILPQGATLAGRLLGTPAEAASWLRTERRRGDSYPLSIKPALDIRLPWLTDFRACGLCARAQQLPSEPPLPHSPHGRTGEGLSAPGSVTDDAPDDDAADGGHRSDSLASERASTESAAACRRTLMKLFTSSDDEGGLQALGAQHVRAGSVHVRPAAVPMKRDGGWLHRHRGGLGRCLPGMVVVGSQRSSLGSLHWAIRRGWHARMRTNVGERELHFFSMDNRYRQGLLSYERRFHPNSTRLGGCDTPSGSGTVPSDHTPEVTIEVSSTYFDYPKAPPRLAAVMPAARIVVLLREPVERALSAFNFRWMTWLCGKLLWVRADCWAGVTSETVIRTSQVGPFQMHAALKLWRGCAAGNRHGAPSIRCLQQDYRAKLRNKTSTELRTLSACTARADTPSTPAAVDWTQCLHLSSVMLGPKQVHKVLEDSSFVLRSMCTRGETLEPKAACAMT